MCIRDRRHTAPPTTDAAPRLAHAGISTGTRSRRFLRTPSTGCRRLLACACGDATHAHARRASIRRACDSYASGGGHRSHARMHRAPPCCCCCMYASARRSIRRAVVVSPRSIASRSAGARTDGDAAAQQRARLEAARRLACTVVARSLTRVHATPRRLRHVTRRLRRLTRRLVSRTQASQQQPDHGDF